MKKLMTVLGAVLVASACSGVSVSHDFNPSTQFSALRTWDWMPVKPSGDPRADNALVDQRLRGAIETDLTAKGLTKATSGEPNFRVGYQLILDDKVDYQTVNNYYGGTWGYRGIYGGGMYGGPAMGMGSSTTTAREYTMGTLVIDIFDVASEELVWRGAAEGKINQTSDVQEKQARATEVVQLILKEFPPKP